MNTCEHCTIGSSKLHSKWRLWKQERAILLSLVDSEANLRNQACLNSFVSGYRLACGIQQELLAERPPYCFADEDERKALKRMEDEKTNR